MSLLDWIHDHFFASVMLGVASVLLVLVVVLALVGALLGAVARRWDGPVGFGFLAAVAALLSGLFLFLNWDFGPPLFAGFVSVGLLVACLVLLIVGLARRRAWPFIAAGVCLILDVAVVVLMFGPLLDLARVVVTTQFLHPEWLALLGLVTLLVLFSFRDVQVWHLLIVVPVLVAALVPLFWFGPALLTYLGVPGLYQVPVLLATAFLVQGVCYLPLAFLRSRRSLAGLGPQREWVALTLRCLLVVFLALALADPQVNDAAQETTVLFVVDRSLSVPEEHDDQKGPSGLPVDHRWERIKDFINQSVTTNAKHRPRDKAGLIVFGRRPRLELPPAAVPRFVFGDATGQVDGSMTDIAAALKLAMASFPEKTGKRVVLFSDGNENLGLALDQVQKAKTNGVQIDVVPLAAGRRDSYEVLVQGIEAPNRIEQGAKVPLRVLVRSLGPDPVPGTLRVVQKSEGEELPVVEEKVVLRQGLNVFSYKQPSTRQERAYTYEAEFTPLRPIAGDRVQNNKATTHVVAHGQRRILLLEGQKGEHAFLMKKLKEASNNEFTLENDVVDSLPLDQGELGAKLSEYDCLILANVAASDITEEGAKVEPGKPLPGVLTKEQQEVIRSAVHDQGLGLIMIGGPNGFGAGGWQDTPIEKALPVDCDVKAIEVEGKGGLVLVMHASEMANGNYWQKEIAKLAIKKLSPHDEVAVLYYDFTAGVKEHIKMQKIGDNREKLLAQVDTLQPGDMPDFTPALQLAHDDLVKGRTDENRLAVKHVIVISDGDPTQSLPNYPATMKSAGITVTTVGVATHGAPQDKALADLAKATGGRFYNVKSANALPQIYTKETRLVSQSYIHENKRGLPLAEGPAFKLGPLTEGIAKVPPVYGLVRTTPKPSALVDRYLSWSDPKGQEFPVLAYWPYGLGKSAAFTSDALVKWDKDWAASDIYTKFWEQVIKGCLRPIESRKMTITTEQRDGKVKVTVETRDEQGRLVGPTDKDRFTLEGHVTSPGGQIDLKGLRFEMKGVGVWEAEFKAEEAGSYFVTAMRVESRDKDGKPVKVFTDRASGGVTVPYSPEFADVATNTELLERLADATGGEVYRETRATPGPEGRLALDEAASKAEAFRPTPPQNQSPNPIWWLLVVLVGVLLLFDVAVRRVAVEPAEVAAKARSVVAGLFARPQAEKAPEYMDRLRSRKASVGETLEKGKASRRFEGETAAAPPPGADAPGQPPPTSRPKPPRPGSVAPDRPEQPAQAEDYASRLMRAKRKAMEGKERPKEEE